MTEEHRELKRVWPPASRPTDPLTSPAGEAQFKATGKRRSIAARVEGALLALPGMTYGEVAIHTGLRPDQVWRRLSDLKNLGRVKQSGTRIFQGYQQGIWWPVVKGDQLPLELD